MAVIKMHSGRTKAGGARKRAPRPAIFPRQVTKKAIPQTASEWYAEYEGVVAHLSTLPQFAAAYGERWVVSMQAYWRQRLTDLRNFPPAGVIPPPVK